jgi:hypothetical protein
MHQCKTHSHFAAHMYTSIELCKDKCAAVMHTFAAGSDSMLPAGSEDKWLLAAGEEGLLHVRRLGTQSQKLEASIEDLRAQ